MSILGAVDVLSQENTGEYLQGFREKNPGELSQPERQLIDRLQNFATTEELKFTYDGHVITAPGTMFSYHEIRDELARIESVKGSQATVAFSFHGNRSVLDREDGLENGSYDYRRLADGSENPRAGILSDFLEGIKQDISLNREEIEQGWDQEVAKQIAELEEIHGLKSPTSEEKSKGCAVVNTADRLLVSVFMYKELFGEKARFYLEDSCTHNGNTDDIFEVFLDDDTLELKFEKHEDNVIQADLIAGCVDETAGIQDFARGIYGHNAKFLSVGVKDEGRINGLLASSTKEPNDPGFGSLHYLHTKVGDNISPINSSTKKHFVHLAEAIALNNGHVADIVIDERILPQYSALLESIGHHEQHGNPAITKVRLFVFGEGNTIRVLENDFVPAIGNESIFMSSLEDEREYSGD